MSVIKTNNAPAAMGPYSQAIVLEQQGFIFTAGQLGMTMAGELVAGGVQEQTHRVLQNMAAILTAAGSDLSRVVKTTVFLKSMDDFVAMNAVYAEYFPTNPPARTTVQVSRLPKDALVEIEAVATLGD